jgi:Domain of unknown function (DUF362)
MIKDGPAALAPVSVQTLAESGYGDRDAVRNGVSSALAYLGTDGLPAFRASVGKSRRVFVLPNHVTHRRDAESDSQYWAKVTHPLVLEATIDSILEDLHPDGRIEIGNSPLQSADYTKIRNEAGIGAIETRLSERNEKRATFHDLRTVKSRWKGSALLEVVEDHSEKSVEVDLGPDSYLDELFFSTSTPRVRVGDYDPKATERYHGIGRHTYVVNRRILESDLVVSVPKLKTHQKVALTCALKGTVGIVSRKECLAHHRQGGSLDGGDEYFGNSVLHKLASSAAHVTSVPRVGLIANAHRFGAKVLYRLSSLPRHAYTGGAWFGNDTAWRMTLDLARILRYADADGVMHDTPQRDHYVLIDGIVGGDGNGPLRPDPVDSRVLIGAIDPFFADFAAAKIMGFNPAVIPILAQAATNRYPITEHTLSNLPSALANGVRVPCESLQGQIEFAPSKGWKPVLGSKG